MAQTVEATTRRIRAADLALDRAHRDDLLYLHRQMYLIRRFEERTQEQYTKAKIGGFCHLNIGEEATVVGGILPLQPQDYIFTTYREHGHALARGIPPGPIMAELFGKATGTSGGRGGSMHIFDASRRFMGGYGIVGGHLPLALGTAFASRYRQLPEVTMCLFGDGATNIGAFHESLNWSRVFKLPVVWFCVNNQYGMGTAVERASAVPEMVRKAVAYDIEAIRVDGMNVLEVMRASERMIEAARSESLPKFIESVTYRFRGHSVADPDKYRPADEKERWKAEDPILEFEQALLQAGVAEEADFQAIRDQVEAEVAAAIEFAENSPNPPLSSLYDKVLANRGKA